MLRDEHASSIVNWSITANFDFVSGLKLAISFNMNAIYLSVYSFNNNEVVNTSKAFQSVKCPCIDRQDNVPRSDT